MFDIYMEIGIELEVEEWIIKLVGTTAWDDFITLYLHSNSHLSFVNFDHTKFLQNLT